MVVSTHKCFRFRSGSHVVTNCACGSMRRGKVAGNSSRTVIASMASPGCAAVKAPKLSLRSCRGRSAVVSLRVRVSARSGDTSRITDGCRLGSVAAAQCGVHTAQPDGLVAGESAHDGVQHVLGQVVKIARRDRGTHRTTSGRTGWGLSMHGKWKEIVNACVRSSDMHMIESSHRVSKIHKLAPVSLLLHLHEKASAHRHASCKKSLKPCCVTHVCAARKAASATVAH